MGHKVGVGENRGESRKGVGERCVAADPDKFRGRVLEDVASGKLYSGH